MRTNEKRMIVALTSTISVLFASPSSAETASRRCYVPWDPHHPSAVKESAAQPVGPVVVLIIGKDGFEQYGIAQLCQSRPTRPGQGPPSQGHTQAQDICEAFWGGIGLGGVLAYMEGCAIGVPATAGALTPPCLFGGMIIAGLVAIGAGICPEAAFPGERPPPGQGRQPGQEQPSGGLGGEGCLEPPPFCPPGEVDAIPSGVTAHDTFNGNRLLGPGDSVGVPVSEPSTPPSGDRGQGDPGGGDPGGGDLAGGDPGCDPGGGSGVGSGGCGE
jgi:hypothetical protein